MQNNIIGYLKTLDTELMDKIISTFANYKKLDFESIKQSEVMILTPKQAFEYAGDEGDKYFKIWVADNRIAWCTWANTLVDSQFRWNSKARNEQKRDNSDLLGNDPYLSEYLKSYNAIDKCSVVYMFPFAAFSEVGQAAETRKKKNTNTANTKKKAESTETSKEQKIEDIIDDLSKLSTSIARQLEIGWSCNDDMTDFQNKLMKLKYLDETNKMIPYFEDLNNKLSQQKPRKSLFDKIIDSLF